jgi:hypothetical protein
MLLEELDRPLRIHHGSNRTRILRDQITGVQQRERHGAIARKSALKHNVRRHEQGVHDFCQRKLRLVRCLHADHRLVRTDHEVDTRVRYYYRLEFRNINVQQTAELQ